MLQTLYNFLTLEECNYLINLYENNKDEIFFYEGNKTWPLNLNKFVSDRVVNKTLQQVSNICVSLNKNIVLDTAQIVKWPTNSFMAEHTDPENDQYACIIYLNENFEGGLTSFEDLFVKTKSGLLVIFPNSEIKHSVTQVTHGTRFTLALWYTKQL